MERRSKERVLNIEIYTDGSCKKLGAKATFGGWAYIVVKDGIEIYSAQGSEKNTTNQRMELTAIYKALQYISKERRKNEKVIIYSDSAYAINCYEQKWYDKWLANGWCNAKGDSVANQDLWSEIIPFYDSFWYEFQKVKGHADSYWNIICDSRAQLAADRIKFGWSKDDV